MKDGALRLDSLAEHLVGEDIILQAEAGRGGCNLQEWRAACSGQVSGAGGEVEAARGLQLVEQGVQQQEQLTSPGTHEGQGSAQVQTQKKRERG